MKIGDIVHGVKDDSRSIYSNQGTYQVLSVSEKTVSVKVLDHPRKQLIGRIYYGVIKTLLKGD